jgi:glutathione synthase/RimK-type ligase-like ATP-grasp enzyme
MFFEGERAFGYSHAVIKKPKGGDFRSQPEFGSKVERHTPTSTEREIAERALDLAGGRARVARVDLVTGLDGKPTVIELEMVEPCLYLGWSDDAAAALAAGSLRRAAEKR